MFIIADNHIPEAARIELEKFGKVVFFKTSGITYPAISGHPDIFVCQTAKGLLIAPNTPEIIKKQLSLHSIAFSEGQKEVGAEYPQTAIYNALITEKYYVHNSQVTDPTLLAYCQELEQIDVKQAYTRCSVLALSNKRFITSDKGIEKALLKKGLQVLFVDPKGILLHGFEHGFFGGTCGTFQDKVFFIGSLDHFPGGQKVKSFLSGYEIIELYDGPLFDGGSLIFIE